MKNNAVDFFEFVFILAFIPASSLFAVGGLSGNKLTVSSADPIPEMTGEFSPDLGGYENKAYFNEYSHRKNLPVDDEERTFWERRDEITQSAVAVRLTGAFSDRFETGLRFSHNSYKLNTDRTAGKEYGYLEWGMKYLLNQGRIVRFALEAGMDLSTENWLPRPKIGGIMTWNITDRLGLDASLDVFSSSKMYEGRDSFIERGAEFNSGLGYKIGSFYPVIELQYSEKYSGRFRYFRLSDVFYQDLDVNTTFEINVNRMLGIPPYVYTESFPYPVKVAELKEKVTVYNKTYTGRTGFVYEINTKNKIIFTASEEFYGSNSPAGRSITAAYRLSFGSGE